MEMSMDAYKTRWKALTANVEPKKPEEKGVHQFCERTKACRQGDYLIKCTKNNPWYGLGVDYINFTYGLNGIMSLGRRCEAAWFLKEEAVEFLKILGKGWKMVKLSKNKK